MDIIKSYNEKDLTIAVTGRIETNTAKDLEDAIDDEMGNFDSLTLDFVDLSYISSAGLRVLIITQKRLMRSNTEFTIKNANEEVKKVFKITGFDNILKIE